MRCVGIVLSLLLATPAFAGDVIWLGIDYSKAKFIGTDDFRDPEEIFPGYLHKWNGLFVDEQLPALEKAVKGRVTLATSAVDAMNMLGSEKQILRQDFGPSVLEQSSFTQEELEAQVHAYFIPEEQGTALVILMDRLVKSQAKACMTAVYFDVHSREVVSQVRGCHPARGFGFRNYWFGPVKAMLPDIKKARPKK